MIRSPEDLEKIPPQRRYLMPLIQTHGGLILRNNAKIYTATQNFRQKDNLIERNGKKNPHTLTANQLFDIKIYIDTLA